MLMTTSFSWNAARAFSRSDSFSAPFEMIAVALAPFPSVTVIFKKSTPNADPSLNANCSPVGFGCVAIVRFETTYTPMTPIIKNILFPSGVTFVATSVEVVEFTCPNATTTAANCPKQP